MIRLLILFSLTFCAQYPAIDSNKPKDRNRIINKVLVDAIPYFRNCYQNYVLVNNESQGVTFKTRFMIKQSGEVLNVEITKGAKLPIDFRRCFVAVLKSLPFPKVKDPGGLIVTNQPFNFYPVDSNRNYPKIDFE